MTCFTVRAESALRKAEDSHGRKIHPPAIPPPPALFTDPGLPTGAKLIVRTLVATWAWSKAECWPGTPAIVAATGLSRGHVQTCLRALERGGWIAREARGRRRIIVLLWRLPGWPGAGRGDPGAPGRWRAALGKNIVSVNRQPERSEKAGAIQRPRPEPETATPISARCEPPPQPARTPEPAPSPTTPTVLGAEESARLAALSPASRERVLTWLATGDRVLIAEARKRLAPPRQAPPPPASTAEMLTRIRECPTHVPQAAELLARDLDDRKSWSGYHARCRDAWEGRIEPEALVEAYREAMGPKARVRGAIFMSRLKRRRRSN